MPASPKKKRRARFAPPSQVQALPALRRYAIVFSTTKKISSLVGLKSYAILRSPCSAEGVFRRRSKDGAGAVPAGEARNLALGRLRGPARPAL